MKYQQVIGLEVHIELKTRLKAFCNCKVAYGQQPNLNSCPYCRGQGVKPKYNPEITECAVRAGIALNCQINKKSLFDRKHYLSQDLPKGYQITQYFYPICQNGYLFLDDGTKINIKQIHIEEDAGKTLNQNGKTVIDFNRSGVPLIEVVTYPDFSCQEQVAEFVEKLQTLMKYAGVSECKMEQGNLRCDLNFSIKTQTACGQRVEIKNLNSISNLKKAIKSEYIRQTQILEQGGKVQNQTLKFDEKSGKCLPMREKEDSNEYGYLPDIDLQPIILDQEFINQTRLNIGELPEEKIKRIINDYQLPEHIAKNLCKYKKVIGFFENAVKQKANPQTVAKLIVGTLFSKLTEDQKEEFNLKFSPTDLAKLAQMVERGYLFNNAQKTLEKMLTGSRLDDLVSEKDLTPVTKEELMELCKTAIQLNNQAVQNYKSGNCKAINALIGYVIKTSGGKVPAGQIQSIIERLIRE